MTSTLSKDTALPSTDRQSQSSRRFGYLVAIGVNAGLLYVANHVLEWGWFAWLTSDFELVLPILNVSLWAAIAANALLFLFDPEWFGLLLQLPQLVISGFVGLRMLSVFPFDFTAYEFPWESFVRWGLILPLIGVGIALIVVTVKLLGRLLRP